MLEFSSRYSRMGLLGTDWAALEGAPMRLGVLAGFWLGCLGCSPAPSGWLVEIHGRVIESGGEGVSGARVDLSNKELGVDLGTVWAGDFGQWSLPVFVSESEFETIWGLHIYAEFEGYLSSEAYWEASWKDSSWPAVPHSLGPGQRVDLGQLRTPGVVLFEDTGPTSVNALVQNSTDGNALSGVAVEVRSGWNSPLTAPVLFEAESAPGGKVQLNLPSPGIYTVHAEASGGFESTVAPLWVGPGAPSEQRILMSPRLVGGALRAALVWRNEARDLDLHMSGPLASEAGRYQVYVSDTPHPVYGEPIAEIERVSDNWETLGVYTLREGTYRFSAHDRELGSVMESEALAAEEPTVLLWTNEGSFMESLFPGAVGTIWQALEFDVSEGLVYRLQGLSEGLNEWDVSAF